MDRSYNTLETVIRMNNTGQTYYTSGDGIKRICRVDVNEKSSQQTSIETIERGSILCAVSGDANQLIFDSLDTYNLVTN